MTKKGYKGDFSYARNYFKEEITNNEPVKLSTTTDENKVISLNNSKEFSVNIPEEGAYGIYANYKILHDGFQNSEFTVEIRNSSSEVISSLDRATLRSYWKNESEDFKLDSFGNEISPNQVLVNENLYQGIYDYQYSTVLPSRFNFAAGDNKILLTMTSGGDIQIDDLYVVREAQILSYSDYTNNHKALAKGARIDDIEAEHYLRKNDTSTIPANDPDLNASPYKTVESVLNVVSNFSTSEQKIDYEFEVKSDGLYTINFNGLVNNSNHVTFASIFIDGEIPFGELMHYPLIPTSKISEYLLVDEHNKPYEIYLTQGTHILTLKVDVSLYREVIKDLKKDIDALNSIYLDLKRIAGTVNDNNHEWNPETDFPGIKEEIQAVVDNLVAIKEFIYKVNGSKINFQSTIYIQSAITALNGILKKPAYIPNQYSKFSEGSGSIIENIATAESDLSTSPFEIDRIIIGNSSDYKLKNKKGGFKSFGEGIKKFFLSFKINYSSKVKDDKTLNIWVARSRQYVDLMQELIDSSDFETQTGYKVKFTILSDESKLILSNAAKISPDGVMGISNWLPYEMGIRNLTVDLTKFTDYGEVLERFSEGAMISLIADEKGLALPETQDFYVMYYRQDILDKYGFSKPDTWTDVIELLPALQRNGFNFYIPLSTASSSKSIMTTAPFIYQFGGNLFSDDGLKTTIDEENSLNAIKMMTELFTNYGLESQVANFFNSFRNGSLPIGVSTFDTYVKLTISAPELAGKWGIMLPPGQKQEDSSIARWQTGSAQSMCLIKQSEEKNNAGWELLKWWSSKDVQAEFAKRLTLRFGKGYIWNSANLDAFKQSIIFKSEEKDTILEQWKWMREIPRVPGWYMLERELSNAWNSIVLNGENTRSVIEDAVDRINKELLRKLDEFGYVDSLGNVLTPYHITTLDSIKKIKEGGKHEDA